MSKLFAITDSKCFVAYYISDDEKVGASVAIDPRVSSNHSEVLRKPLKIGDRVYLTEAGTDAESQTGIVDRIIPLDAGGIVEAIKEIKRRTPSWSETMSEWIDANK